MLQSNRKIKGFSLVELLIVMGILGVLTALIVPNIASGRERARDAVRKSDFASLRGALRLYYNDYQQYPAGSGDIEGCGVDGDDVCSWAGGSFEANDIIYMKKLPGNPSGDNEYSYTQTNGGEGFLLEVEMESLGDESIAKSQIRCGVSLASDVYVTCEK